MTAIFKGKLILAGLNAKTTKGDKAGQYATAIMYLAPHTSAGVGNVCAMAERAKCVDGCLNKAGLASVYKSIGEARRRKTVLYMTERKTFLATLVKDLERFMAWCGKRGVLPAVRLNGTSDIQYERGHAVVRNGLIYSSVFEAFPEISFYDYTKIYTRVDRQLPSNYALTLSYSGANARYATEIMGRITQANVAVVYRTKERAEKEVAFGAIRGDATDMRFLDPQGHHIVALYAKGPAKKDQTGFVVD